LEKILIKYLAGILFLAVSSISALSAVSQNIQADVDEVIFRIDSFYPDLVEYEMNSINWVRPGIGLEYSNSAAGAPDLPWITQLVEIPDQAGVELEILDSVAQELGVFNVLPVQDRWLDTNEDVEAEFQIDESIYNLEEFWPQEAVQLSNPVILRNRRLVKVSWSPLRWNPASGELQYTPEIELKLVFSGQNPHNAIRKHISVQASPFDKIHKSEILGLASTSASISGIFDQADFPGTYAIVVKSAIATNPALVDFINWKRQKGHVVHIISDAEVGEFTAPNIRSAIRGLYFLDIFPPDYVLLIGDVDNSDFGIPAGDWSHDGQQDHYYSKIDGEDFLGDVAVGRFSVSSHSQLASVIHKVMSYEITPTLAGEDWLKTAAASTGYSAISMVHLCESIVQHWMNAGYEEIETLWFSSNSSWVNTRFNEGVAQYCYRGYIGMNGVTVSFIQDDSNFNNSYKTPVAAIFTCATGDFISGLSTTEAFFRKGSIDNPRGAVAAMGFATSYTHTAYNNAVVAGYYGGHHDLGLSAIGPALFYGKYNLWATLPEGNYNAEVFGNRANLMGDPGMDVWQGLPDSVFVNVLDGDTLNFGNAVAEIFVSDTNGQALSGLCVCLQQDGGIFARALSGEDGIARLELHAAIPGDLNLTVSHQRYIPYRGTLSIYPAESAAQLLYAENAMRIIPGIQNEVIPTVVNSGQTDLNNVWAAVSSVTNFPGVLIDTLSFIGNLQSGQQASGNGWAIILNADVRDGERFYLPQTISASEASFSDQLIVSVSSALPVAVSYSYNGEELLQSGDDIQFGIVLQNQGELSVTGLELVLESADPELRVEDSGFTLDTFESGSTAELTFSISLDRTAFSGSQRQLDLNWNCNEGPAGIVPITITVDQSHSLAPAGPDDYGYYAYEYFDNNTLSPVFEWLEISGTGQRLDLNDTYNEQDDAVLIDLPFEFVYYGVGHNQITICSNGFVSFSEGAENDPHFRNHRLPSSTGPGSMIAPFWDDLLISDDNEDSGVYVYHDQEANSFVIQWNEMEANGQGGNNTFQLILYDPLYYPTPTGDGEFLMSWLEFNDDQSHTYDFPHASIGFENHSSTHGLSFSNFGVVNPAITGFADGMAIFVSTKLGQINLNEMDPPTVNFDPRPYTLADAPFTLQLEASDLAGISSAILFWSVNGEEQQIEMNNTGGAEFSATLPGYPEGSIISTWAIVTDDSNNQNQAVTDVYEISALSGFPPTGPDNFGHFIYENIDEGGQAYEWLDISSSGTEIDFTTAVLELIDVSQLNLIWYGEQLDDIAISGVGTVAPNASSFGISQIVEMGIGEGTDKQICPLWSLGMPSAGGEYYYKIDSLAGKLIISWIDLPSFSSGSAEYYTFQLVFYDAEVYPTINGDSALLFQYQELGDLANTSIGFQNANGEDGISFLYSGNYGADAGELIEFSSLLVSSGWGTGLTNGITAHSFDLRAIYPNPFNPFARINYTLDQPGLAKLNVYNIQGQLVRTLVEEYKLPGEYEQNFDGSGLSSGVYIFKLDSKSGTKINKAIFLK
jgi:hypothetical protein